MQPSNGRSSTSWHNEGTALVRTLPRLAPDDVARRKRHPHATKTLFEVRSLRLAADTVVSMEGRFLWNGVRKLFKLSDHHRVAAMVFGNASFMGEHWGERIIPAFVEKTGSKSYPTIAAWTNAFAAFVAGYNVHDPARAQANIDAFVFSLMDDFEREVKASIGAEGALRGFEEDEACIEIMKARSSVARSMPIVDKQGVKAIETLGARAIKAACDRKWIVGKPQLRRQVRAFITASIAGFEPSTMGSGIVIAGYGSTQSAPALCELRLEPRLGPVMKMHLAQDIDMATEPHSRIIPFAQRDMADAFLTGMDADLRTYIGDALNVLLVDRLTDLAPDEASVDRYLAVAREIGRAFELRLESHCTRVYTHDVLPMVDALPPHDLPGLAQALIRLAAMRHTYSIGDRSVGEPIDAALMSRAHRSVDLRGLVTPETIWRMAS